MDDDYVSLSVETNKDETFVIAQNAGFVPLSVAAIARARRRESISCSVPGREGSMEHVGHTQKATNRGSGQVKLADTCLQHHLKPLRQKLI